MRDRQASRPILDPRDEPRAISPAEFTAHLMAHRELDERLAALESRAARRSDPVVFERTSNRLLFRARGTYTIALALLATLYGGLWLILR